MALEDLTPVTRTEAILDGDDISPVTRMEYFLGKAANEVPKPSGISDAGKVLTVNSDGDCFELDTPESGLPAYTSSDAGKGLGVYEEVFTVIPEQSISFTDGYGTAVGVDFSHVEIGDEVAFVGHAMGQTVTLTGEVVADGTGKQIVLGDDYFKADGSAYISELVTFGTITMDVDAVTVTGDIVTGWVITGLPDWSGSSDGATLTIVDGEPIWYYKQQ